MHRTTADVRASGVRPEVERLTRAHPEWRAWLELAGRALDPAHAQPWASLEVRCAATRPPDAPVLHGATLALPARAAGRWLRRLLRDASRADWPAAGALRAADFRGLDALALLAAAATGRGARIAELAQAHDAPADALAAIAHLAALPLMLTACERVADRVPADWPHGWCPVCGAWPVLAEQRGIDRARWLRCGRCGGGWPFAWLRCPYCGDQRHDRLGSLVPEREEDTRRIEKCESCRGYVKSLTVLRATPAWALPLEDLRTVELDMAATGRGYGRPTHGAWLLELDIVDRAGGRP